MLRIRGKPGKSQGESSLSPGNFPGFLGSEAIYLFVTPARQAELVFSPQLPQSPTGMQGMKSLAAGLEARSPQRLLHAGFEICP